MNSIMFRRIDKDAKLPSGNPFLVFSMSFADTGVAESMVRTGIGLDIPDDIMLDVQPANQGQYVAGWELSKERGNELILHVRGWPKIQVGDLVARVTLREAKMASVRFCETEFKGGVR